MTIAIGDVFVSTARRGGRVEKRTVQVAELWPNDTGRPRWGCARASRAVVVNVATGRRYAVTYQRLLTASVYKRGVVR